MTEDTNSSVNIEDEIGDEVSVMDCTLYIIKNSLPMAIVDNLPNLISHIRGVRHVCDMNAFVMIEFDKKVHADAAKATGFQFEHNGQNNSIQFFLAGGVAMYMMQNFNPQQFKGY